jgi:hypothetical protein
MASMYSPIRLALANAGVRPIRIDRQHRGALIARTALARANILGVLSAHLMADPDKV